MNFIKVRFVIVCFAVALAFSNSSRIPEPISSPISQDLIPDQQPGFLFEALSRRHRASLGRSKHDLQPEIVQETTADVENQPILTVGQQLVSPNQEEPSPVEANTELDRATASPCGRHKACSAREEALERRISLLKRNILEKLRLDAPPNITASRLPKNSPPIRAMYKKYGLDKMKATLEEDEETEIKTQKVISTAKLPPRQYTRRNSSNWFYFEFSAEEIRDFNIKSADLWIYIRPTNASRTSAVLAIDDYRTIFNDTIRGYEISPRMNLRRGVDLSRHGNKGFWRKISLTGLVTGWMKYPERNFGIEISSRGVLDLVANGLRDGEEGLKPFLDVEMVSSHRRKKRSALENCNPEEENRCCLYDFHINFEKIGWDWIIFPHAYNAKYCRGECSIIQLSTMRSTIARHTNVGRPEQVKNCCVPKHYAPLSMLYYDNAANIVYSEIPDMEIRQCDCV